MKPKEIKINDHVYYVYKSGKVTNKDGDVICEKGGRKCLMDKVSYTTFHYNDMEFRIFNDGHSEFTNGTTILPEGGKDKLIKWVKANYPTPFEYDGKTYYIYEDGHVIDDEGVILTKGGLPKLKELLIPEKTLVINDVPYKIFKDGRVLFNNGTEFLPEGGEEALKNKVMVESIFNYEGVKYYIFPDGRVELENGTVFMEDGGLTELKFRITKTVYVDDGEKYFIY